MQTGPLNLITDVPGIRVGNAEDGHIRTGCTVVLGDAAFTAGYHVMGGAPGTRETDLLHPDKSIETVDALVLSGGSGFGLDAGSGVADALAEDGRGFPVGTGASQVRVPIVPGAILFDLINGGDKDWGKNPYKRLGRAAYSAASDTFGLGTAGAGTGGTTATLKGGLGSASMVLPGGIVVGAVVAVNALGSATVGDTEHFWAAPWEEGGEFGGLGVASHYPTGRPATKILSQNTTIAVVATNAALTKAQCTRLATAAHDGIARALVPSHTPKDGDLIFAASTGAVPCDDLLWLGHAAATCVARASARGVYLATPAPNDLMPTWRQKFGSG